jgi:O-antigen ligase
MSAVHCRNPSFVFKTFLQKITFPRISLWLLGLMCVLPFFGYHHYLPIPSFYNEWFAAALGLAALILFVRNRYWQDMELPLIALVPLGFVVILLIQIPIERVLFPERSILGASYLLWAVLLMMLARTLVRELGLSEVVRTLAWFLLLGGILNAGIAFFQYFKVDSFLDPYIIKKVRVPFANIAQPNHFSDFIALALGSLLLLFSQRRLHAATTLLTGVVLLVALSFSGSRSSWLYVLTMAALSLAYLWINGRRGGARLALAGLLLLPGFALIHYLLPLLVQSLASTAVLGTVSTPTDNLFTLAGSKSDRLAIWLEAWQIFLKAPLLGTGFGEFAWQHFLFSEQAPEVIRGLLYNHSHNIVMQVLAELGIFATLLLVGGTLAWLLRLGRTGTFTAEKWWLLALISVLAIHSMLEYPLWYAYFLGIAAVLLGVGETRALRLNMQGAGRKIFVLLFILGAISVFNLINSYGNFERAFYGFGKNLSKESDMTALEADAQKLVSQVMHIHRESLLSSYAEIAMSRGITLDKDKIASKLEVNGRAMRVAPINEVVYRHAVLLGLNGEHQAAARQFDLAAAAYPRDAAAVVSLIRRKAAQDEAGFLPLLQHAEGWLRAHSAAVAKTGIIPAQVSAVPASAVRQP